MLATETPATKHEVTTRTRLRLFTVGLPVVVVLAAVLRLWSIDFGLPLVTHPDEPLIYDAADRMIANRTLNPHWFRYPAFIIDIEAAILAAVYAVDKTVGLSDDTIRSLGYGGGRVVMAAFGIATVALTGLIGRRLTRIALADDDTHDTERLASIAGLVAAAMLAVSFIHVKDSHYLKPDVPTGFFTALTLWFALGVWTEPHPPTPSPTGRGRSARRIKLPLPVGEGVGGWGLTASSVGLAAAAKYTGGVVAVVPAMALLLLVLERRLTLRKAIRIAVGMAIVAVVAFLVFNPYVLLAPDEFLSPVDGIRAELEHYRTGHDGAEGNDSWRWYLGETWRNGFGPTLTPLVLLGGVMAARQLLVDRRRGTRALWLVLIFLPVYYVMIARYPVRFDRQLIPLLPYLAVLGGFGVAATLTLINRAGRLKLATGSLVTLLLVGLLAVPLAIRAADWNIETGKPDTRYAALDWIEANVPPGATIVREWHTPPVAQAGYEDIFIRAAYEQPLAWYEATGADYIVLSSYMYARYLDAPTTYPTEAAFYQRLFSIPPATFIEGDNGPDLFIYRLEDAKEALPVSQ